MHAPKSSPATTPTAPAGDAGLLEQREAAQLSAEAKLGVRKEDLLRREQASAAKLAQQRGELTALTRSRAGGLAVDALGKLPSGPADPAPLRELLEALEARRAALEARQRALEAEQKEIARREEALARLDQSLDAVGRVIADIQGKSRELLEAEKAEEARLRAQKARSAAVPPPVPSQARPPEPRQGEAQVGEQRARPAPRSPASGAVATGPQEAVKPDVANRLRRSQRVALHADVDLFSDSNFYTGFSSDLSDGGIFVATCNMLEPGTEVEVAFTLPGSLRIQAKGVVRWNREYNDRFPEVFPGVGIEFVEMAEDSRLAVHAFTSQREPMFWAS